MSHPSNTDLLEYLYENYIELGFSPDEAERAARAEFEAAAEVEIELDDVVEENTFVTRGIGDLYQ